MKKIEYDSTYLSTDIVEQCFNMSNYSFVDKQLTGNGFTTAFLNLDVPKGLSNVIIVPNREVVIDKKQQQQNTLRYGTDEEKANIKNIGFFYGDISSDKLEFDKYDVMMFVVDSWLNYEGSLKMNIDLINRILVDEVHSMIIQSTFRSRLVGFLDNLKESYSSKKIVSVTATPMLFNNVDIKLYKANIEQRTINISTNQESTLKRIQTDLKNGKNVLVALQDVRILKKLCNEDGVFEASIKVGKTLMLKMCEAFNLKINKESNLTVISSAGFEGFDVNNGINNVYIFEDRAFDYQTFYSQNIVQIIGRSRKGTDYIEWCRMPISNRTKLFDKDVMVKKANSKRISHEKKLSDKNYSYIPKYFDFKKDEFLGLITEFKLNDTKYNLDKELHDTDLKGVGVIYKEFFNERGFTLNFLNEGHKRLNLRNVSSKIAFDNLKLNKKIIKLYKLVEGLKLNLYKQENTDQYIKNFQVYLRRKYWYLDNLPFEKDFVLDHATHEAKSKLLSNIEKELFAYRIITDEKELNEACKIILKESIAKKKQELNRKSKEFQKWKQDLIYNLKDRYIRLIMAFSQKYIKLPEKIKNSRDYNLSTEVSSDLIYAVSDLYDMELRSFDIRSCNIRIMYSICGLELPNNIYGDNKVNKKKINMLLNKISSDFPKQFKQDINRYKKNRIADLKSYNIHPKVIFFLMDNFFDKPRDAVFNFCTHHEKVIINKLKEDIFNGLCEGLVRRHDEVLYFGAIGQQQLDKIADFEYLDAKGWFIEVVN